MSRQSGMAPHYFLSQLSQHLPRLVDSITPRGEVPDERYQSERIEFGRGASGRHGPLGLSRGRDALRKLLDMESKLLDMEKRPSATVLQQAAC